MDHLNLLIPCNAGCNPLNVIFTSREQYYGHIRKAKKCHEDAVKITQQQRDDHFQLHYMNAVKDLSKDLFKTFFSRGSVYTKFKQLLTKL